MSTYLYLGVAKMTFDLWNYRKIIRIAREQFFNLSYFITDQLQV